MSFLFETQSIPFWFLLFILLSAVPLWLKWFQLFYNKFIRSGILQNKIHQVTKTAENNFKDLKKGSAMKTHNRTPHKKELDHTKKQHIKTVLITLAHHGDKGVLPKSICDETSISSIEVSSALSYMMDKEYVEEINGTHGLQYYLTALGKKYCLNKKIIS